MRRPIVAGNWKMYKNCRETGAFFERFSPLMEASKHCDIVVCPTFVNLYAAVEATRGSQIEIGGQDLYWEKEGAYTGEVSGDMLTAVGCRWVIVAHSERRQYFCETDGTANKKAIAALNAGLTPIICVGERLEHRDSGQTEAVLQRQFDGGIAALNAEQFSKIVIAYEPVWAIGTGRTATADQASAAHHHLRNLIRAKYGEGAASACRILYGGSVKPDNIKELMADQDIDGALVGGASLDPQSFASIVNY